MRDAPPVDRDGLTPDTLGLRLAEAKDLLVAVQDSLVEQQVQRAVSAQVACPDCGVPRRHKDTRTIVGKTPRDREELPRLQLPLVVGLDGGYVHSAAQRSRRDGWFEVIASKAMPTEGIPSCFASDRQPNNTC
jgi:hypothetical protein